MGLAHFTGGDVGSRLAMLAERATTSNDSKTQQYEEGQTIRDLQVGLKYFFLLVVLHSPAQGDGKGSNKANEKNLG